MKTMPNLLILLCIFLFSCNSNNEPAVTFVPKDEQGRIDQKIIKDYITQEGLRMKMTESGIHYNLEALGRKSKKEVYGSDARIVAHYHGVFLDGKIFDSSVAKGKPFVFELGTVIPGWREAIRMMGMGGKGTFIIPSDLAYGPKGYPGLIDPNTVLMFDIELLAVD